MKTIALISYLLFICYLNYAQVSEKTPGSKINQSDLKNYISVLTSDSLAGRETGSVGQIKAADYIANHFRNLKLEASNNSFFDEFELKESYWRDVYIRTKTAKLFNFVDLIYFGTDTLNSEQEKEVVFGGYGSEDELKQINVEGKIVFLFLKNLRSDYKIRTILGKLKAYAVITANPDNDKQFEAMKISFKRHLTGKHVSLLQNNDNTSLSWLENIDLVPSIAIPNNAIKNILGLSVKELQKSIANNELSKLPSVKIGVKLERISHTIKVANVCGIIKGKSEKSIVISAHYDHLGQNDEGDYFPGADDNASGTAALIELAEEFSNCNNLNYNIIFLATTGEEKGLLGAKHFVGRSDFDTQNIICNLNIDMIARNDTSHSRKDNYLYCLGSSKWPDLKELLIKADNNFNDCSFHFGQDNNDILDLYGASDHYMFYKKQIPALFFFSGLHNDYHQLTDTKDKINYSVLEKRVRLISNVINQLQKECPASIIDRTKQQ